MNISNNKIYYASIIMFIVGISILKFFLGAICYIYILLTMIDIIIKEKYNIKKGIIYIHAVGYFGPDVYNYISNNNYKINYFYAIDNVITYLGFISLLFSIRYVNIERGKVNELNEDLNKNVTLSKNLKINMDFDKHLGGVSIDIKDTIYKTIQESLTNSIKHGQANQVSICIKLRKRVYIVFKDNGIGCNVLNKSNGLKGIEKRIFLLGGGVKFKTKMDKGFTTIAFIPIKWGENYDKVKVLIEI